MRKRIQTILVGLFFAVQFLHAGAGIYRLVSTPTPPSEAGWSPEQDGDRVVVRSVTAGGPAANLHIGDEIVAVDGQRFGKASQVRDYLSKLEPESVYTVILNRGGRLYETSLRADQIPLIQVTLFVAAIAAILAVFLITGFAVFVLKPNDKQALLLALMFGMFTGVLPFSYPGEAASWLTTIAVGSHIVSFFFWPVFFHFFLTFPEPSPLLRRFPRLELYLYLPFLLTFFPYLVAYPVLERFAPEWIAAVGAGLIWLGKAGSVLVVMYVTGGLLSLLANYRQAGRASQRRMRVVVAGSIAGFLPAFLFVAAIVLFNLPKTNPSLLPWLALVVLFAFPVFPLSFAYAIVRHQVIPVRLILRRGVRYVFVSQGSIVLELAAVFLALTFLLDSFFTHLKTSSGLVIGVISGAVSIVVWEITGLLHRRVIAPTIDRRFFRQAYNAQQILAEVGNALRGMTDLKEMATLASAKIQDSLHTENVTIFLCDEASGNYFSITSSYMIEDGRVTAGAKSALLLAGDSLAVRRLQHSAAPLLVDFNDTKSWAYGLVSEQSESHQRERDTLRKINAALLLPIATKDRLLGIISLGPRLGDLPFSREDRQLLLAVAWQMAMAVENSQLVRRMAQEERLRHELDMATEVQRRIFPESPPAVPSVELAGVCHPARGVGGDYYDFLTLDGGKIGIAVADVAGKGISAALLMSIVQASLRSQAPSINGRLTELVSSMNGLLHRSTGASGYASFFYAQFDEQTSVLTYVNAGHNPPMLVHSPVSSDGERAPLRARGVGGTASEMKSPHHGPSVATTPGGTGPVWGDRDETLLVTETASAESAIVPLTTGGVVIGLFEDSKYEQEAIQMRSGDLLVAYTDGVTEALNSRGEEFGEPRLRRLVSDSTHLQVEELSSKIVQTVSEWSGAVPQQDDLTLVIMRVK